MHQLIFKQVQSFLLLGLAFVLPSCRSSHSASDESKGFVSGVAEIVLHHGIYNPNGKNETVTPVAGKWIVIVDEDGERFDSSLTDEHGAFTLSLPEGEWKIHPPELEPTAFSKMTGQGPTVQSIELEENDSVNVMFRWDIFAP